MSEYSKLGLPGNTAEISDYWQNLGELCDKMASESRGRSSILEKKWSKESRHAFGEALKIRIVVFGKDHPKTKHVEKFA
jgi:SET and MYND domain-containing protein